MWCGLLLISNIYFAYRIALGFFFVTIENCLVLKNMTGLSHGEFDNMKENSFVICMN